MARLRILLSIMFYGVPVRIFMLHDSVIDKQVGLSKWCLPVYVMYNSPTANKSVVRMFR